MRTDVLTRSATVVIWCFFMRHFAFALFRERRSAERWYHAGSWARMWGVILIADRLVLCFFAVFSILVMSSLRFSALGPFRGTFHDCRNGFSRTLSVMLVGAVANIM